MAIGDSETAEARTCRHELKLVKGEVKWLHARYAKENEWLKFDLLRLLRRHNTKTSTELQTRSRYCDARQLSKSKELRRRLIETAKPRSQNIAMSYKVEEP